MEKYREDQKERHGVFVELKKTYDRVQRRELWCCMRKSGSGREVIVNGLVLT